MQIPSGNVRFALVLAKGIHRCVPGGAWKVIRMSLRKYYRDSNVFLVMFTIPVLYILLAN